MYHDINHDIHLSHFVDLGERALQTKIYFIINILLHIGGNIAITLATGTETAW